MKKCPFCAEQIQDDAIKCRYCGSMLDGASHQGMPRGAPDAVQAEATRVLGSTGKIEAIKFVRERKALAWPRRRPMSKRSALPGIPTKRRSVPPKSGACFTMLLLMAALVAAIVFASSRLLAQQSARPGIDWPPVPRHRRQRHGRRLSSAGSMERCHRPERPLDGSCPWSLSFQSRRLG